MSVSRDAERGTWYVHLRYKDVFGVLKSTNKRGFKTKSEARKWELEEMERRNRQPTMTLSHFITLYLKDIEPRIRKGTMATKMSMIKKYIVPKLGEKRICDITSADILQWENWLLSLGLSPTYVHTICNQMSAIINHAIRHYGLQANPMLAAGKVGEKKPAKPMEFWTQDEFEAFIDALADKPDYYMAFMVLYWTGIREGELLGLQPRDIDQEHGTVRIRRSFSRVGGEDILGPTKTKKSVREVLLPDFLLEELEDYLTTRDGLADTDRIFSMTKSSLSNALKLGCKRSGIKRIRVHDLRHSHVSLLINLGFSVEAIADRMGHESASVTSMYAHLFPSTQKSLVSALEKAGKHE